MKAGDWYRQHRNPALRRAYFRGRGARMSALTLADNPYGVVAANAKARSGSWTESYKNAWARGWHDEDRDRQMIAAAAVPQTAEHTEGEA